MDRKEIIENIRKAGVVGAGGAGFPSHIKVDSDADTVIVNGAECEPLLYKDKELLRLKADRLVQAVELIRDAMGARRGVIALKEKEANREAIDSYQTLLKGRSGMEVFLMGDYYPAGDEVLLVYDVTGKVPPFGGLPKDVGAMNSNVETFLWMLDAMEGIPVTEKWVTIAGAVKRPITIKVPVGISFRECLEAAGGPTDSDYGILAGGVMMANVVDDDDIVDKTSAGWVILPKSHYSYQRKTQDQPVYDKIGKSCCDQCLYCTEFCPRYLVGHPIEPHRVMRTLGLSGPGKFLETEFSQACIHCGLCGLFACPESLSPHEISWNARGILAASEFKPQKQITAKAHPMYEHRKVPHGRLMTRLGLEQYNVSAHFEPLELNPERVSLKMKQHAGVPATPIVNKGDSVAKGQLIGDIPAGKLGALVHASIGGRVESVDDEAVVIRRD